MTAKAGTQPEQKATQQQRPDDRRVDLGVRYGAIGISAVAAAARYAGEARNDAYAPVVHRVEKRFTEVAAA